MNSTTELLFILALLVPLWRLLQRDFLKALSYGVFLCVSLTTLLRIETGGVLPELTVHRLILISLFVVWFKTPAYRARLRELPLQRQFKFWMFANFISLLFTSTEYMDSIKAYLDFVLEISVFYAIVCTSVRTRDDALNIMKAAVLGLGFVAALGILEHYTRFNPVDAYLPNYEREDVAGRDVLSTFPHRILLGTAMAMAWPICMALMHKNAGEVLKKRTSWIVLSCCLSTCFFAQSRGPWIACMVGGVVIAVLGSPRVRKVLAIIPVLALLTFIIKPGVFESLNEYAAETTDADSFKAGTAKYRLELWKVAWAQISKSPQRLLFGYGPGTGRKADVTWSLSYRDKDVLIESWDNQFAADLYCSGLIGAAATLWLFFGLIMQLYRLARVDPGPDKDLVICILASVAAMVFMMTNVFIFAKQLYYLLWSLSACGFALGGAYGRQEVDADVESELKPEFTARESAGQVA